MQKFIRFGIIPSNEKSVNWFKLSFDEQDDINWFLECGDTLEEALKREGIADKDIYEAGVSAFYLENGMPRIDNLQQLISLNSRMDYDVYVFDGDVVGLGTDNEPLVSNIRNVEKISLESITDYIESILKANYSEIGEAYCKDLKVWANDAGVSITGEYYPESVMFNGKEYFKPVESWNTKTGCYAYRNN